MDDLNDLIWTQPGATQAGANGLAAGRTSSPFASSFDMLAGSSSSSSANQSHTSSPMPRTLTPSATGLPVAQPPKPTRSPVNGSSGSDAFAGLFSLGAGSPPTTGLSLAQRQAKLAAQQQEKKAAETRAFQASGSFWDKFEQDAPKSAAAVSPALVPAARTSSPLLAPNPQSRTPSSPLKPSSKTIAAAPLPAVASKPSLDPWDEFDMLASRPAPSSSSSVPAPASSDPFDFLDQPAPKPSRTPTPRASTPKNHDFGDKGWGGDDARGLMANRDGSDDDDFMQAFTKPTPEPAGPASSQQEQASRIARPSSPPIHLIGQLVEMGFAPSAAREALAATDSGQDVETATAILLSAASTSRTGPGSDGGEDEEDEDFIERERRRKEDEEAERRRRRRQGPSRSAVVPDRMASPAEPGAPGGDLVAPLQDLMATTNLIGQNVFNRANALWSSSKQQVQKAYEERQKANASTAAGATGARDGRPKWMVDAAAVAGEEAESKAPEARREAGGFRDGDEDKDEGPGLLNSWRGSQSNAQASSSRRPPPSQQQIAPSLVEPEAPRSYTSSRRHLPKPSATFAAGSAAAPRPPSRQPSPAVPLKQRNIVSAPAQILAAADGHRTKGNDAFKLGQFGEAEAAYTTAIDMLPDHHLRLVPLLNNRAAARLKNGDHAASAADSTTVITLVGLDYDPAKEAPLPADMTDLALGDALVKAVSKRAAALEMAERWAQARDDWELAGRLEACKGASRTVALDGARRCRKMVDVLEGKTTTSALAAAPRPAAARPTAPARPNPKASSSAPPADGASMRLKEANAALAAEEAQRSELKDSVDGRVGAWKAGKEANLRALIASLDSVLWPELGWQTVGLHELVTDKQVKVRYTRAIGKLHPDKLAVGQTTVEQRMIAGAVFGTLNEAWNSSQK